MLERQRFMINYCQFEQADAFLVSLKFNLYICSAATWEKRKKEAHFAGEKPEDDERDKIMMGIKCKLERAADTNCCVFWELSRCENSVFAWAVLWRQTPLQRCAKI